MSRKGKILFESDATWEKLQQVKMKDREPRQRETSYFQWMHFATHFSADIHTGRLSGFRLWDCDIYLDQLRDLAPLPQLITFSACNGVLSFIHEGDEHVDLPTTCFVGGANTVIGSLWPIPDDAAARFSVFFYDHYLQGMDPAHALRETQKQLIAEGKQVSTWGGLICMGVP